MTDRERQYYTQARAANQAIWDGINTLLSMQREWNALDYGNTMADGDGPHVGVTKAEVGAVVFDTANNLSALLNNQVPTQGGWATNMAKLL